MNNRRPTEIEQHRGVYAAVAAYIAVQWIGVVVVIAFVGGGQ